MKRTAGNPANPQSSVHVNGSSRKSPKRKWKPELERDRSMRAYNLNPRALREAIDERVRELLVDEVTRCLGLASESRYGARCRSQDCRDAASAARRRRRQRKLGRA